jgi:thiamine biosynthesis lipoprotein
MRINREARQHPVPVSDDLFDFIATAKRLYDQTGGAFDVSSTPLVRCWGFFTRNPRIPTQREIDEARANVGMEHVQLDEEKCTVFFTREGLELTPASMGKGFAIDRAVAIARERGLQDVLLNGGFSSVYASGAPAWKDHWQIDVRNPLGSEKPLARLRLCNQGFSSSGSEDQKILADGHLFSHIIDPRTGWPAEEMLNINVVAPTATEAEALSTAFFVLGVEKTLEYCENHSEIGVVMLAAAQQPGGHPRVITANLDPSQVEVV